MPTSAEWQRVGAEIREAREARRWNHPDLATQSGLSVSTILHLEHGVAKNYSRNTRRSIEVTFRWAPGDIERILAGGSPTTDEGLQYVMDSWWRLSPQVRAIIVGNVEDALSAGSAPGRPRR